LSSRLSIRLVLISVRDLDRSIAFYQDVMNLEDAVREGELVALGSRESTEPALLLRQADRQATRHGKDELGARAICFNVASPAELDRVHERLKSLNALHDRRILGETDLVRGHDPDSLPILFVAGTPTLRHLMDPDLFRQEAPLMHTLDS
jgi:catechol-2,3-dioxygenase